MSEQKPGAWVGCVLLLLAVAIGVIVGVIAGFILRGTI